MYLSFILSKRGGRPVIGFSICSGGRVTIELESVQAKESGIAFGLTKLVEMYAMKHSLLLMTPSIRVTNHGTGRTEAMLALGDRRISLSSVEHAELRNGEARVSFVDSRDAMRKEIVANDQSRRISLNGDKDGSDTSPGSPRSARSLSPRANSSPR